MKKWHMIIGLPKTGSSWLGDVIAKSNNSHYFREFFNPWTWKHNNLSLSNKLSEAFGYEEKTIHIAKPWQENLKIEEVFDKTWLFPKDKKIIDKEVWSFCNIEFFCKNFNISIIHRKPELIFWGDGQNKNQDAFLFYKSIYNSFIQNINFYEEKDILPLKNARTILDQCLAAHSLATKILFQQAEEFDIPILDYEELIIKGGKLLKNKIHPDLFNEELVENINQTKFDTNFVKKRKIQNKIKKIKFL